MRKLFLPALLSVILSSCGGGEPKKEEEKPAIEEKKADITTNPDYQKGLTLISQSDCLTCHKVNEASTGPAYADVAARYANAADTTITRLGKKIISGGAGDWGAIPMSPHPTVSQADAEQMVKYVLLLKKQ
jgi:cytochrome c